MPNPFAVVNQFTGQRVWSVDGSGNTLQAGTVASGDGVVLTENAVPSNPSGMDLKVFTPDGVELWTVDAFGRKTQVTGGPEEGGVAWLNVRAFGATGNGTTDDTAAILAAIAAAEATGGPAVVYLPAGTYLTSASLVLTSNTRLLGDGKGVTVILAATGALFDVVSTPIPPSSGTAGYAQQYIGIEHLEINCSQMTGTTAGQGNGIHFYGVKYSYIRDVYVNAAVNWSILLDGDTTNFGYNIEVRQCLINNGSAGIWMTGCEACFLIENEILQANSTIAANQPAFGTQDKNALLVRCSSGFETIIGNIIGSSGTYTTEAIRVSNNGPVRIIGNRFDKCRYQAINLQSGNCVIVGNQIGNASSVGSVAAIQVGAATTTIVGNVFDLVNGAAHYTYCVAEAAGPYTGNIIQGNQMNPGTSGTVFLNAGSTAHVSGNAGYNPVGVVGPPAVPATTVTYTNHYGSDATVYVAGATVTAIAVNATATGITGGAVRVCSGETIALTYATGTPTWTWFLD
jgi:hypothetical protein